MDAIFWVLVAIMFEIWIGGILIYLRLGRITK